MFISGIYLSVCKCSRGISLWKKGELTEKQPIWVGDVAAGIIALVKDPSTAGKDYQFVGQVFSNKNNHNFLHREYNFFF